MKSPSLPCPCGSEQAYQQCCQAYHKGTPAPNAEALMCSRYTAYVLNLEDYLLQTWHENTRPESLNLHEEPRPRWLGLQVKRTETTSSETAIVEFVARYKINGKAERIHEVSQFIHINQRWYYLDGSQIQQQN